MQRLSEYVDAVTSGEVVTGRLTKLAIERFKNDLLRDDLDFRIDAVQLVIDFIETLVHGTDQSAGKQFKLEPWQVFIVVNIFGFFWKHNGRRRFTSSYIQVARKNGKTALSVAICLYNLIIESDKGAEILLAANSAKQVKDVVFTAVQNYINRLDPRAELLKLYYNEVRIKKSNSYMKIVASDVKSLAGYNTSFGLIDEFAFAPNHALREMFRTSMIMRENPHLCTITTAGFDTTSPCYELRNSCVSILEGISTDDSLFTVLYELDENDDWTDEKNWIKANPNIDITVRRDTLRESIKRAIANPSIEVDTRTLNLNQWMSTRETWIPDNVVGQCFRNVKMEDYKFQDCFVGVDLAKTRDMTSMVFLFVSGAASEEIYTFFSYFFIPNDTISNSLDTYKYRNWVNQHHLQVTPGNVCDYNYITEKLLEFNKEYYILDVAYDQWNASQWAIQCTYEGLPMKAFSQAIGSFSEPTLELERLMLSGRVVFANNDVLRENFRNVSLRRDINQNVKPDRSNVAKKIDGVIAAIMSLGSYQRSGYLSNVNSTIY